MPELAVDVENPAPEKVAEDFGEWFAFGEVAEVGLQNVLHVGGVRRHHCATRAEAVNYDGVGRGLGYVFGVPVEETVAVPVERNEASNDWV